VGPGAMSRRWAPLTRDTRKGIISEYNENFIVLFLMLENPGEAMLPPPLQTAITPTVLIVL